MNFTEQLEAAKPNAKPNTIKTYNTILKTIYKKVFSDTPSPDINNFKNVEAILKHVENDPLQTRKTKLSAIQALTPMPEYRDKIFEDADNLRKETNKSEMTDKLEAAEITPEEMTSVVARVKNIADAINKKKELTMNDLQEIQNYIIVSLYHGHIPPRRSMDMTELVLTPTDKETQNYIDLKKSQLVFNNYKTAATYGKQIVNIPPALKKILTKWIKIIPDDVKTMLFNSKREPLTSVTLNQRFNEIFGGPKSVNSMRHFYLTQNHSEAIRADDALSLDMIAMGSNIAQKKVYIKINGKPNIPI